MEMSSQEDQEMAIPISSKYGGHHMIHHHDHVPDDTAPPTNSTTNPQIPSNGHGNHDHDHVGYNLMMSNMKIKQQGVKYKECLKNHAASMGGNATDGCGEFLPNGEEGSIEALTCSACNCHRNFHRKEFEGEANLTLPYNYHHHHHHHHPLQPQQRKLMLTHHNNKIRSAVPHQMIMPYMISSIPNANSESEDHITEEARLAPPYNHQMKKRFRTKFTQEQKEKMLIFAEKAGWKIQRQEESVVQQFCQEIGVKRRVLKVWMHNNKHNLAKKSNIDDYDNDDDDNNTKNVSNLTLSGSDNTPGPALQHHASNNA